MKAHLMSTGLFDRVVPDEPVPPVKAGSSLFVLLLLLLLVLLVLVRVLVLLLLHLLLLLVLLHHHHHHHLVLVLVFVLLFVVSICGSLPGGFKFKNSIFVSVAADWWGVPCACHQR